MSYGEREIRKVGSNRLRLFENHPSLVNHSLDCRQGPVSARRPLLRLFLALLFGCELHDQVLVEDIVSLVGCGELSFRRS